MGIWHASCGCSVSRSMFGEREIVHVQPCLKHGQNKELQAALETANTLMLKLTEENAA